MKSQPISTKDVIVFLVSCCVPSLWVIGSHAADIPADAVKLVRIQVGETANLERKAWPVIVGVAINADDAADPAGQWLLAQEAGEDQAKVVPFQVLSVQTPTYVAPGSSAVGAESSTTPALVRMPAPKDDMRLVEIVFQADLPPAGNARYQLYRVAAGTNTVKVSQPLGYTGAGIGMTVDTGPAVFRFHPVSGQLMSYTSKLAGIEDEKGFRQTTQLPVHWNPDVLAPPNTWSSVRDWDNQKPDRKFEYLAAQGPIAFRTARSGTIPSGNGVFASVTYTAFAGVPFLLESSMMRFTEDTRVEAVRANELVFNRGVYTHVGWRDESGQVRTARCYDPAEPKTFRGIVAKMWPDIPWIGLYHEQKRSGVGWVNLSRLNYAPGSLAGPQGDRAYYYALDYGEHGTEQHYDLNFLYICRAQIFHRTVVPKGAIFAEHSAILVFAVEQEPAERFTSVERWAKLLANPVRVDVR